MADREALMLGLVMIAGGVEWQAVTTHEVRHYKRGRSLTLRSIADGGWAVHRLGFPFVVAGGESPDKAVQAMRRKLFDLDEDGPHSGAEWVRECRAALEVER